MLAHRRQSGQIIPLSLSLPSSFINVLIPAVFVFTLLHCNAEAVKAVQQTQVFFKQLCLNFRHEISLNIKFLRKIPEISILYSFCLHWISLVDKKRSVMEPDQARCFFFSSNFKSELCNLRQSCYQKSSANKETTQDYLSTRSCVTHPFMIIRFLQLQFEIFPGSLWLLILTAMYIV